MGREVGRELVLRCTWKLKLFKCVKHISYAFKKYFAVKMLWKWYTSGGPGGRQVEIKGLFVHRKWDSFQFLVFLHLTVCLSFLFFFTAFQWFPKFNLIITKKNKMGIFLVLWVMVLDYTCSSCMACMFFVLLCR